MSGQVPAKIVLKSTTKMSLNDRFTNIAKTRPPPNTGPQIRANMMVQQQVSAKNRRLAQQLANRPGLGGAEYDIQQMAGPAPGMMMTMQGQQGTGVAAAMRLKKRSLQQRLGRGNIKARLNMSAVGRGQQRGGGQRGMRRGARGNRRGQRGGYNEQFGRQQSAGGDSQSGLNRGRGGRGMRRGFRGAQRGTRGGAGTMRGRGRGGNQGGRFQRGGRFRGRGRGRGGGRGAPQSQMSREELDNQLEEYMSKTKNHLDTELDAYMADAS